MHISDGCLIKFGQQKKDCGDMDPEGGCATQKATKTPFLESDNRTRCANLLPRSWGYFPAIDFGECHRPVRIVYRDYSSTAHLLDVNWRDRPPSIIPD